ncbi:MAG TPA: cytochrome c peroxidase [Gemmatimonadaceae bacterium]|nr:cytochrome c peroxidase [Gemmatimonadaceae bacterium]
MFALLALVGAVTRHSTNTDPASDVRASLAQNVDSLDAAITAIGVTLAPGPATVVDEQQVRAAFRRARARYKHLEAAVEFYAPALAAAFNSRRQEVDDDDAPPPSTLSPTGFPALESLLWPRLEPATADSARHIIESMRPLTVRMRSLIPALVPTQSQVIEIARLELGRVSTLGIAGFDAPHSGDAMREGAQAIDGVRELMNIAGPGFWNRLAQERQAVDSSLGRAGTYLRANPDFETFNRLAFISSYAQPAALAIDALRRASNTVPIRIPRAWRFDAPSVYSNGAFNVRAYAPTTAPASSPELIDLGKRLFFDPSLSGTGTRSCASCHNPSRAFSDGLVKARNITPNGPAIARNTPTLINAALQPAQFADERSATLEDQVLEVLRSPAEMASSAEQAAATVGVNAFYISEFKGAFGGEQAPTVSALHVRQALAAYVRTLVSFDSRFDHAIRGDTSALTVEERRGFTLFMGRAACGTCHFAPLFSGTTPPLYMSSDVEVIGTSASPRKPAVLDADSGRAHVDQLPAHVRAFKTPSLRNVALTAPYMHNGAFRTLDEVILFYDGGGGGGAGARIVNQTLSADSLHLSAADRQAIVAFLGALTDTSVVGVSRPRN